MSETLSVAPETGVKKEAKKGDKKEMSERELARLKNIQLQKILARLDFVGDTSMSPTQLRRARLEAAREILAGADTVGKRMMLEKNMSMPEPGDRVLRDRPKNSEALSPEEVISLIAQAETVDEIIRVFNKSSRISMIENFSQLSEACLNRILQISSEINRNQAEKIFTKAFQDFFEKHSLGEV
ncbi:MAG: hypothetical protein V1664_02860 [Candidatus Uhrbacteria bacterium]